jgi:copper chaperone
MTAFEIQDMTCGHCASTITKALQRLDPKAVVTVDLAQHRLTVASDAVPAEALQAAIAEAGYTPVPC